MDHQSEGDGNTVLDARDVYVLMRRGCRISRNIRASWYFQHLNSVIPFTPQEHVGESEEELSILSVVPPDGQPPLRPGQTCSVCITPQTIVTFLASRYRLAFTLDLSPSIMSVNICDGLVVNDELMLTLSNCLHGLVKPVEKVIEEDVPRLYNYPTETTSEVPNEYERHLLFLKERNLRRAEQCPT